MDAILQGQQADPVVVDTTVSERPEWLPEKFVRDGKPDYEALAKSYAELEKAKGATPEQKAAVDPNAVDPNGEAAKAAVEGVGLKFDEFTTEWSEKGELSADSYAKLEKAGIPKALVDQYIAGQTAISDAQVNAAKQAVFSAAGGEGAYKAAVDWAAANMTKDEKIAFNAVLDGMNVEQMKLAVSGLVERARKGGGIEPTNLEAQSGAGDSGYSSVDQMVIDMQDPRYEKDASFRAKVARKIAASNNI